MKKRYFLYLILFALVACTKDPIDIIEPTAISITSVTPIRDAQSKLCGFSIVGSGLSSDVVMQAEGMTITSQVMGDTTAQVQFTTPASGRYVLIAEGTASSDSLVLYLQEPNSLKWMGTLTTAPVSPQINWAYYNSITNCSYIFDGTVWQILVQGGTNEKDTRPTISMRTNDTTIFVNDFITLNTVAIDPNFNTRSIALEKGYIWAFDGKTFADTTDTGSIEVSFVTEGEYTVWVAAIDDAGLISDPDPVVITVVKSPISGIVFYGDSGLWSGDHFNPCKYEYDPISKRLNMKWMNGSTDSVKSHGYYTCNMTGAIDTMTWYLFGTGYSKFPYGSNGFINGNIQFNEQDVVVYEVRNDDNGNPIYAKGFNKTFDENGVVIDSILYEHTMTYVFYEQNLPITQRITGNIFIDTTISFIYTPISSIGDYTFPSPTFSSIGEPYFGGSSISNRSLIRSFHANGRVKESYTVISDVVSTKDYTTENGLWQGTEGYDMTSVLGGRYKREYAKVKVNPITNEVILEKIPNEF